MLTLLISAGLLVDPCTGDLPSPGRTFSGVVRYVGDGDGLCVGPAGRPDLWVEVRLQDFYAPELAEPGGRAARQALVDLAMGRRLVCVAGRRSFDRVVARCTLDGRPIDQLLRERGVVEGGRGR